MRLLNFLTASKALQERGLHGFDPGIPVRTDEDRAERLPRVERATILEDLRRPDQRIFYYVVHYCYTTVQW
jgi:hypothetical protein